MRDATKRVGWACIASVLLLCAPRVVHARRSSACIESSQVVGQAHCHAFGYGWNVERAPNLMLEIGVQNSAVWIDTLPANILSMGGNRTVVSTHGGVVFLPTLTLGYDWFIYDSIFMGIHARAGYGPMVAADMTPDAPGTRVHTTSGVGTVEGMLSVGISRTLGYFVLRASFSAGVRGLWLPGSVRYGESVYTLPDGGVRATGALLPQLEVGVWLHPWLTLNFGVAADLLPPYEMGGTIAFRFSTRSYTGQRD